MSHRHDILDDDGNLLAPPEPGTDAANVIYLLEYARKRGFRLGGTLKVGEIVVQVVDLRQAAQQDRPSAPDIEPGSDMAVLLGD